MKHEWNASKTSLLRPDSVIIELKATIPNKFGNNYNNHHFLQTYTKIFLKPTYARLRFFKLKTQ